MAANSDGAAWTAEAAIALEELGANAVNAARSAGVKHLIWSTLPDVETISGGRLKVPHFTMKAHVDAVVGSAGFERYTFVEAPFYFQNFLKAFPPQPLPDGRRGWAVPMDPAARDAALQRKTPSREDQRSSCETAHDPFPATDAESSSLWSIDRSSYFETKTQRPIAAPSRPR